MYVSVPKNYNGIAFQRNEVKKQPLSEQSESENCKECKGRDKDLGCMMDALKSRKGGPLDTEDFLLVGLILLLLGKDGNEDIVLALAMLLLI